MGVGLPRRGGVAYRQSSKYISEGLSLWLAVTRVPSGMCTIVCVLVKLLSRWIKSIIVESVIVMGFKRKLATQKIINPGPSIK